MPSRPRLVRLIASGTVAGVAVALVLGLAGPACGLPVPPGAELIQPAPEIAAEPAINPQEFFDELVRRYRHLVAYADQVRLSQIIDRSGETSRHMETELSCAVEEGRLRVTTPMRQAVGALGWPLSLRAASPAERARLRYDLWLAPHMALKFTDEPLQEFRSGVDDGFTATKAMPVTVEDRPMVQVQLQSGDPDHPDDREVQATFDLFVNPDSMLIERIEGAQRLPDGETVHTTLDITPLQVSSEPVPALVPAAPISPPASPGPDLPAPPR